MSNKIANFKSLPSHWSNIAQIIKPLPNPWTNENIVNFKMQNIKIKIKWVTKIKLILFLFFKSRFHKKMWSQISIFSQNPPVPLFTFSFVHFSQNSPSLYSRAPFVHLNSKNASQFRKHWTINLDNIVL